MKMNTIPLGVSNRHIHMTKEDYETLFQEKMTKRSDLVQPGQYATNQTVTIKTNKSKLENVRLLGPFRPYTQLEISKTDAYTLGIDPPIKNSGDLKGASEVEIVGPAGTIKKECAILANRHIHMTEEDREQLGLAGIEEVSIQVEGEKSGILDHVYIKVDPSYRLECHLDTDDANSHLLKTADRVEIIRPPKNH